MLCACLASHAAMNNEGFPLQPLLHFAQHNPAIKLSSFEIPEKPRVT